MIRIVVSILVGIALLVIVPASTLALPKVPPGNSEVDQYVPTVPDAGGDVPLDGGGGGAVDGDLPPSTVERLEATGADRDLVVAVTARGSRSSEDTPDDGGHDGARGESIGSGPAASASVGGVLLDALTSRNQGGMGILLPILLGALAGLGVFLVLRRRSSPGG